MDLLSRLNQFGESRVAMFPFRLPVRRDIGVPIPGISITAAGFGGIGPGKAGRLADKVARIKAPRPFRSVPDTALDGAVDRHIHGQGDGFVAGLFGPLDQHRAGFMVLMIELKPQRAAGGRSYLFHTVMGAGRQGQQRGGGPGPRAVANSPSGWAI